MGFGVVAINETAVLAEADSGGEVVRLFPSRKGGFNARLSMKPAASSMSVSQ